MTLSIIIINYKTPQLTCRCIESVLQGGLNDMEILVVDNASNDGSKEIITAAYPMVKWIQNKNNEGFGRANNLGILNATGRFVLLLNSDMIVPEGVLEACLAEMGNRPNVGVLGCKLVNEDGSFQKSTYSVARFRDLLDLNLVFNNLVKTARHRIEAVQGSFMLMLRSVMDEVGGFDPDFFMYSEELDLCRRIAKKGYKIHYFDKVSAVHKQGGSITNQTWSLKQRYLSNALLYYKVRGLTGYLLYHFLFLLNTATNFFAMWLLDKDYRLGYFQIQKAYLSNFVQYLKIPFLYTRKPGDGKRMLRAS